MEDIMGVLDMIIEKKNWSSEVFVEKVVEFAVSEGVEDALIDFMLSCEIESIVEDECGQTE